MNRSRSAVRGVACSPGRGQPLAARARPLVAEADAMVATWSREAGTGAADRLCVGIMLDGAGAATVPMLRAFRAAFPQVAVHVRALNAHRVVDGVIDGSVDVALLHGPVDDARVAVVPLFTEPRIAAVSLASPHADAAQLTCGRLRHTARPHPPTGSARRLGGLLHPRARTRRRAARPVRRAHSVPGGAALRDRPRPGLPDDARDLRHTYPGRALRRALRAGSGPPAGHVRDRAPPPGRPGR